MYNEIYIVRTRGSWNNRLHLWISFLKRFFVDFRPWIWPPPALGGRTRHEKQQARWRPGSTNTEKTRIPQKARRLCLRLLQRWPWLRYRLGSRTQDEGSRKKTKWPGRRGIDVARKRRTGKEAIQTANASRTRKWTISLTKNPTQKVHNDRKQTEMKRFPKCLDYYTSHA